MSEIRDRFRGFLPVVVDVETGGFDPGADAILEIAACILRMDQDGRLQTHATHHYHVAPFPGANIEDSALRFTGIDPYHPFREAVPEREALTGIFDAIRRELKARECNRAVLVGHNAHFDASFIAAAVERCDMKRNPFHPFSHFDTATLAGLAFGHTVLARACELANIQFDTYRAHSALYDAKRTAQLFCEIVNRWEAMGGWQPPD